MSLQRLLSLAPDQPRSAALERLFEREQERLHKLWESEQQFWREHPGAVIVGADEVGRGPLAGPLVAAAVAFQAPLMQLGLNDSKKLGESERELVFEQLKKVKIRYALSMISPEEIGQGNLHLLSLKAIEMAVRKLQVEPALVLIDGRYRVPQLEAPQRPVIGGDRLCASIAAASIMAKVTRDRIMVEYDQLYPGFGLAQNKGYPTEEHRQALRSQGPTPIHRANFGPVRALLNEQLQLFKKARSPRKKANRGDTGLLSTGD